MVANYKGFTLFEVDIACTYVFLLDTNCATQTYVHGSFCYDS